MNQLYVYSFLNPTHTAIHCYHNYNYECLHEHSSSILTPSQMAHRQLVSSQRHCQWESKREPTKTQNTDTLFSLSLPPLSLGHTCYVSSGHSISFISPQTKQPLLSLSLSLLLSLTVSQTNITRSRGSQLRKLAPLLGKVCAYIEQTYRLVCTNCRHTVIVHSGIQFTLDSLLGSVYSLLPRQLQPMYCNRPAPYLTIYHYEDTHSYTQVIYQITSLYFLVITL